MALQTHISSFFARSYQTLEIVLSQWHGSILAIEPETKRRRRAMEKNTHTQKIQNEINICMQCAAEHTMWVHLKVSTMVSTQFYVLVKTKLIIGVYVHVHCIADDFHFFLPLFLYVQRHTRAFIWASNDNVKFYDNKSNHIIIIHLVESSFSHSHSHTHTRSFSSLCLWIWLCPYNHPRSILSHRIGTETERDSKFV